MPLVSVYFEVVLHWPPTVHCSHTLGESAVVMGVDTSLVLRFQAFSLYTPYWNYASSRPITCMGYDVAILLDWGSVLTVMSDTSAIVCLCTSHTSLGVIIPVVFTWEDPILCVNKSRSNSINKTLSHNPHHKHKSMTCIFVIYQIPPCEVPFLIKKGVLYSTVPSKDMLYR